MKILSRILRKYNELSKTVKAALWFTICNVLQRGIQFIVTPIYTRLLTTDQYGVYSLFMTWMNIFMIFGTLNMSAGIYYNGIIKDGRDVNSYTSSLQVLSSVCSIITFTIVLIVNALIPDLLNIPNELILLMFLHVIVYPALGFWSAQKRILYKYKPILIITLIASAFAPIVGILLVKNTNLGGYGVIIGFVSINILINGFLFLRNLWLGKFKVKMQDWKDTLRFSIPLIPHYLSQVVLGQFDRIMINHYCGESKAGIYTLVYQVGLIMSILISGINNAFTPWVYQQIKAKNYSRIRKVMNVLLMFFFIINVTLILIAPEIIAILGTSEYQEAMWAVPPIMLSSFVTFVYCIFGTVLFYFEDTRRASLATTVGAVLNVILNAICIPAFGYITAGYTTLASYLIIFILYYFFMKKRCEKENIVGVFDVKSIIWITMVLVLTSSLALLLYSAEVIRYAVFIATLLALFFKRRRIIVMVQAIKSEFYTSKQIK